MQIYTSIAGDMVDLICRRHFGDESGFVAQVLAANAGLAALGPVLPSGIEIELPDLPAPTDLPAISLWA
jgi:phage tail protein X